MGGFGSGGWSDYYNRKTSVEQCKAISTKTLKDYGFFAGNVSGMIVWKNDFGENIGAVEIRSVLDTQKNNKWIEIYSSNDVNQKIELTATICNFGGLRYWFLCPAVKNGVYCGNRAAKLYLPPTAQYFGCRECYDLTYESCQKSHKYDRIIDHIPEDLDLEGLNLTQVLRLASL